MVGRLRALLGALEHEARELGHGAHRVRAACQDLQHEACDVRGLGYLSRESGEARSVLRFAKGDASEQAERIGVELGGLGESPNLDAFRCLWVPSATS